MNPLTQFRRLAAIGRGVKYSPITTGNIRVGGSGSTPYMGNWTDGDFPSQIARSTSGGRSAVWIPGTHINWDQVTGEVLNCPASRACLNWIFRNRSQAPVMTETLDDQGQWDADPASLATKLLRRPNPMYDGDTLLNQAVFSLDVNGNAYIVVERTKGGDVAELYWWPHNYVEVPNDYTDIIGSYILQDRRGRRTEVSADDVYHLRFGLDPDDWRFGMSPTAAEKRGVYSLQQSANYRANILRNFGTVGAILSAKDSSSVFDPELVKTAWRDKTRGDNVGDVFAIDVPIDVNFPGVSPQSMAIDTMDDRPESDVCALRGLPPQVVGLHVGRLSRTYANMKEAREAAWEECIIPTNNLIACQLGYRLLPDMARLTDPAQRAAYLETYRMAFDYREVRPLQQDLDKLNFRELAVFMAGASTLGQFCQATKRPEPPPELADSRYKDLNGEPADQGAVTRTIGRAAGAKSLLQGSKAIDWGSRHEMELSLLEELEQTVLAGAAGTSHSASANGRNGTN